MWDGLHRGIRGLVVVHMTMHLSFPKPYVPCIHAAEAELREAEADYEAARDLGMGGYRGSMPHMENIERFRAARERFFVAREIRREARMREFRIPQPGTWEKNV